MSERAVRAHVRKDEEWCARVRAAGLRVRVFSLGKCDAHTMRRKEMEYTRSNKQGG